MIDLIPHHVVVDMKRHRNTLTHTDRRVLYIYIYIYIYIIKRQWRFCNRKIFIHVQQKSVRLCTPMLVSTTVLSKHDRYRPSIYIYIYISILSNRWYSLSSATKSKAPLTLRLKHLSCRMTIFRLFRVSSGVPMRLAHIATFGS